MASLISAVSWIPRGVAAQHPSKYVVDEKELDRVGQLARVRLEDAQLELELAQATQTDDARDNMDDDEDESGSQEDDNEDEWQE